MENQNIILFISEFNKRVDGIEASVAVIAETVDEIRKGHDRLLELVAKIEKKYINDGETNTYNDRTGRIGGAS